MELKSRYIIFFMFLMCKLSASNNINVEYLKRESSKYDFHQEIEKKSYKDKVKAHSNKEKHTNRKTSSKDITIIVAISALLLLLTYFVVKYQRGLKFFINKKTTPLFQMEEKKLESISIETLGKMEIEKRYNEATILLYKHLIELLDKKKHVIIDPKKTNKSYLKEISNRLYKDDFFLLSYYFNVARYSKSYISDSDYSSAKNAYTKIYFSLYSL